MFGQDGGNMPIIASQQKEHRHIKGQVALAQIKPGNFVLKLCQGKAVALPTPDEVDQAGFIVLTADQISFPVERSAWNTPPNRSTHLPVVTFRPLKHMGAADDS
ncbi:MAG: hypothetical protein ABI619_06345 [Betaproteobacteria bacterium]